MVKDPFYGDVESAAWSSTARIRVTTHKPKASHKTSDGENGSGKAAAANNNSSSSSALTLSQPVRTSSGYTNCQPNWAVPGPAKILKWKLCSGDPKAPSFPSPKEVEKKLPSVPVNFDLINRFSPFASFAAANTPDSKESNLTGDDGNEPINTRRPPSQQLDVLGATWMGHSAFIVTAGGYTILTDPVWSYRASPVQFAGPARMLPPPIPLDDLPYIDIVTISHNHYDHLDTASVTHLIKHNHCQAAARAGIPQAQQHVKTHPIFVVPMGMKERWFVPLAKTVRDLDLTKVVELMWWDTADLTDAVAHNRSIVSSTLREVQKLQPSSQEAPNSLPLPPFSVTAVPVQHWSQRGALDRNCELWCGFVYTVEGKDKKEEEGEGKKNEDEHHAGTKEKKSSSSSFFRFFHCGDTGYYKKIFEEIGREFGPFDFSMIPIGAYEPRNVMANQHVDPFEAVEIHKDIKSLNSAGMHWGTFILTDEPIDEPPKALAVAVAESNGSILKTPAADDDANAERLKILRQKNFLASATSSLLISDGGVIPYVKCSKPFRALRHGETWMIPAQRKQ